MACLSEKTYCETPGNIDYLTLDESQMRLIEALAKTGKPVVTVLAESRHLVILRIVPYSRAIVRAHLPGEQREPWPTFCSAS